jgi:hypothetical protein
MSLHDAAKAAREHADVCVARPCHHLALALEGALRAESDALLSADLTEEADIVGIPTWSEVSVSEAGDDLIG